ncbi:MAG TPA: 3-deoxy-D-manno-octulosonic acid transferase, partial [Thermodesulfovibrionales bacterium]|nr:3-deoxy-D-manno-octulosonic acid transferase [Thermodesulfovibrionales bacterium]
SKPIWVHAVSVGEVITAVPFIREIKARHPSLRIVLSTVTDTGQQVAEEQVSEMADIVYLPFDLAGIFRRVFRNMRPVLFIAVETELWPNIFRTCSTEGIPVIVVNGRVSDDSFKGYKRIRFFIQHVLRCVDLFCMQDTLYAERIEALGASRDKVRVTGNFKFDTKPPEKLPEWAGLLRGTVILAGSTHEGEEELMVSVFGNLKDDFPDLNLILAPRHPERFGRVEAMVKAKGFECVRRSDIPSRGQERTMLTGRIILLDTIGELAAVYGVSDISVIGGSFVQHGGQNPLEPAFWGKPVVCGPHMENFPFIQEFYSVSGAVNTDAEGLLEVLRELLRSPGKRKILGERARSLYRDKAGAVRRTADALEGYLKLQ